MSKGTLLARMGFEDRELSTPLHDEILIWCLENPIAVLRGHPGRARNGKENDIANNAEKYRLTTSVIEPPIYGYDRRDMILGFLDLRLSFVDDSDADECRHHSVVVNVEIKTAIKSLGELVRQINVTGANVIVCPDDRFAEILRGQGVGFVKYPGPITMQGSLL